MKKCKIKLSLSSFFSHLAVIFLIPLYSLIIAAGISFAVALGWTPDKIKMCTFDLIFAVAGCASFILSKIFNIIYNKKPKEKRDLWLFFTILMDLCAIVLISIEVLSNDKSIDFDMSSALLSFFVVNMMLIMVYGHNSETWESKKISMMEKNMKKNIERAIKESKANLIYEKIKSESLDLKTEGQTIKSIFKKIESSKINK